MEFLGLAVNEIDSCRGEPEKRRLLELGELGELSELGVSRPRISEILQGKADLTKSISAFDPAIQVLNRTVTKQISACGGVVLK